MVVGRVPGLRLREDLKLKEKKDIDLLFKKKNKKYLDSLLIYYNPSDSFRFLISFKKRLLNPVRRNGLKRQVREFIRRNQYNLKNINCAILIVKIPSSNSQLLNELEFLIK